MNDLRRFSLRRNRYNLGCFLAVNFIKATSEMTCKLKVTITLSTSELLYKTLNTYWQFLLQDQPAKLS